MKPSQHFLFVTCTGTLISSILGVQSSVAQQCVVRYVEETAYTTEWRMVPVTSYTQTVTYGLFGTPYYAWRPTLSYRWEPVRVAHTTRRPVYETSQRETVGGPAQLAPAGVIDTYFQLKDVDDKDILLKMETSRGKVLNSELIPVNNN